MKVAEAPTIFLTLISGVPLNPIEFPLNAPVKMVAETPPVILIVPVPSIILLLRSKLPPS